MRRGLLRAPWPFTTARIIDIGCMSLRGKCQRHVDVACSVDLSARSVLDVRIRATAPGLGEVGAPAWTMLNLLQPHGLQRPADKMRGFEEETEPAETYDANMLLQDQSCRRPSGGRVRAWCATLRNWPRLGSVANHQQLVGWRPRTPYLDPLSGKHRNK